MLIPPTAYRFDPKKHDRPRCRIGRLPEVETLAAHLRNQGFVVVAAGVVADGRTKIYATARGVGVEALFFSELVSSFFSVLFCRVILPPYFPPPPSPVQL